MRNGEVLLLTGGHLAIVLEIDFPDKGMCQIQLMETNQPTLADMKNLERDSINYGLSREVVVPFLATRSIHLRLNHLTKV